MSKIFSCGDIHGAYRALKQCLERSGFNKEEDTLIQLGDVVDGWSEVYECVEELLTIKNLVAIKGNHCDWFNEWLLTTTHPDNWRQGGGGTLKSYCKHLDKSYHNKMFSGHITNLLNSDIPEPHRNFFNKQLLYYIDEKNRCFIHGGFNRKVKLKEQDHYVYYWDRNLWDKAKSCVNDQKLNTADDFSEIFIGHTHVDDWRNPKCLPLSFGGVTNLDTGAGWAGKLTIMNVETKEYWQSDLVQDLYPEETNGRK